MARENPPQRELADLVAQLSGPKARLASGYALRGPERYFREQALAAIKQAAGAQGCEVLEHDASADGFSLQNACDDLRGGGLFSTRRCVVLRSADEILVKEGGGESTAMRSVRTFLAAKQGPVVLEGDGLRVDNASVKLLLQTGGVSASFRRLYDAPAPWDRDQDPLSAELVQWVIARARARSLSLTPVQALLLVQARGNDPAALENELAQFAAGRSLELGGLSADAAGAPFRLAEALLDSDLARALRESETLWRGGMQKEGGGRETGGGALVAVLLIGLRRGVRQAYSLAASMERGVDFDVAAAECGVSSFAATRAALRRQVASLPARLWRKRLEDVTRLELGSKDGRGIDVSDVTALALAWSAQVSGARRPASKLGASSPPRMRT